MNVKHIGLFIKELFKENIKKYIISFKKVLFRNNI